MPACHHTGCLSWSDARAIPRFLPFLTYGPMAEAVRRSKVYSSAHSHFFCKMIRWVWRREHAKTHPLFWIDSLCIPAQDDLRTVSTHIMSKIYCDVIYTSVLDQAWPSARGTTERHPATVVHFRLCLDATNLDLERGAVCQKSILLFGFWHCC